MPMTTTTPTVPNPKHGDVVLVLFPHSDLRTAKLRPALIVDVQRTFKVCRTCLMN